MSMNKRFQIKPGQANILGTRIDLLDYMQAIRKIEKVIENREHCTVGFVNVYTIMQALEDEATRSVIDNLSISVPDGMPLVWLSRYTDTPLKERVYGPDFFLHCCERSQAGSYSHFLYGSKPEVLQLLELNLKTRFPKIQIAGTHAPPFRPMNREEENQTIEKINASGADILWIALGSPNQEKWMLRVRARIQIPVMAAVGAAFDFHAGVIKQAPQKWQKSGFEWLYRLIQEPGRLSKRYLYYNPLFVLAIAKQAMGLNRSSN